MAAHALLRDEAGRVLLVDPVYESRWILPGGAVERDESPRAGCAREVAEELGLERRLGGLLVVEWRAPRPGLTEGLMFVYDAGVLPATARLRLPAEELAAVRWVEPDAVAGFVTDELARRVRAALDALAEGRLIDLEDGVRATDR